MINNTVTGVALMYNVAYCGQMYIKGTISLPFKYELTIEEHIFESF